MVTKVTIDWRTVVSRTEKAALMKVTLSDAL